MTLGKSAEVNGPRYVHERAPTVERRLVAGASGQRRIVGPRDDPARFLPPHISDRAGARTVLAAQARAGADVLLAPTFGTYRRTLARFGEGRRAAEWTRAAVTLAREAADLIAQEEPGTTDEPVRSAPVLVAGSMVPLTARSDSAQHLWSEPAPDPTTAAREHAAHAGILAESRVDLIVVEGMGRMAEARIATAAAAESGFPVWTSAWLSPAGDSLSSGEQLGDWLEAVFPVAPQMVLLHSDRPDTLEAALRQTSEHTSTARGAILHLDREPETGGAGSGSGLRAAAEGWLEAGASAVGICCGATPERLVMLRTALTERAHGDGLLGREAAERWLRWVATAAEQAPGGEALWLDAGRGDAADRAVEGVPPGFAWTHAPHDDAGQLPRGHYRLIVSPAAGPVLTILERLLEPGGV
ncbi:MAG: homocysteine S-methyltransferase family protein, partial [Chloroflexi bacterium]|nr:homocysteine S-methyltransferase family protein [Chloroflexota bacterium]